MRILLIRHGESYGNVDPLAYGLGDPNVGITKLGRRQLRGTHNFLQQFCLENPYEGLIHPQAVDISSYKRTRQSARLCTHFLRKNPDVRFQYDEALREQSFGLLYRMHGECDEKLSARIELSKVAYKKDPFNAVPPDGESPFMHYERTMPVTERMRREKEEFGISYRWVVAHGATNRHIATDFLGLPATAWKDIENQNNGDVWILEDKENGFTLFKIYDGPSGQRVFYNPVKSSFTLAPAP